jgi:outer membrane protein assembly factor BamA
MSGTGRLGIEGKFPKLVPGWRFALRLWMQREARQNYFGIGNDTDSDSDNVTDAQPYYYRQDRKRMYVRGTIQREIVRGLRALAGFHVERFRIDTLPGPSIYGDQVVAGLVPPPDQATVDASIRAGLVYDTRDDEVDPSSGMHIEAIYSRADSALAGDVSYRRITVSAAGHLPVAERVSVGVRLVGQSVGGVPPQGTYYMIETSEAQFNGLGGPASHRGLAADRFLGEDKLFGNLDIRYRAVGERHLFTGNLVGFLDVGRVFQPGADDFSLTLQDMHVGGGFGMIITYSRTGVLGWTIGYGPDGPVFQTQVGWIF